MAALRVLVVEDEAVIAELLVDVLAGMGHIVCAIVDTEADAVAEAARLRPDLILVDVRLAEGNGVSAIDRILRERYVPHVLMSGDFATVAKLRPRAVAIEKPFSGADLVHAIGEALTRSPPAATERVA